MYPMHFAPRAALFRSCFRSWLFVTRLTSSTAARRNNGQFRAFLHKKSHAGFRFSLPSEIAKIDRRSKPVTAGIRGFRSCNRRDSAKCCGGTIRIQATVIFCAMGKTGGDGCDWAGRRDWDHEDQAWIGDCFVVSFCTGAAWFRRSRRRAHEGACEGASPRGPVGRRRRPRFGSLDGAAFQCRPVERSAWRCNRARANGRLPGGRTCNQRRVW
jgi:hypothetical protein